MKQGGGMTASPEVFSVEAWLRDNPLDIQFPPVELAQVHEALHGSHPAALMSLQGEIRAHNLSSAYIWHARTPEQFLGMNTTGLCRRHSHTRAA